MTETKQCSLAALATLGINAFAIWSQHDFKSIQDYLMLGVHSAITALSVYVSKCLIDYKAGLYLAKPLIICTVAVLTSFCISFCIGSIGFPIGVFKDFPYVLLGIVAASLACNCIIEENLGSELFNAGSELFNAGLELFNANQESEFDLDAVAEFVQ